MCAAAQIIYFLEVAMRNAHIEIFKCTLWKFDKNGSQFEAYVSEEKVIYRKLKGPVRA